MERILNEIEDVILNDKERILTLYHAGNDQELERMGYKLCQMGDYGKIWLGPDFGTNFDFLHWWWDKKYNQEAETHGKLADKSGLTSKRIPQLHCEYDGRFAESYFPTEEDLQQLAEFYQIPKEALKGWSWTTEQMVKSRKNS